KRQTESSWEVDRQENALLRERINDVAAEVARLTVALEGPQSPINAILADAAPPHGAANGAAPAKATGSLADRIRALQARSVHPSPLA
ncbi:MAG: hypothetical protein IT538_15770, partial [Variibacter sp.]|nr:hypothetical protein [Variibacter sp.]